MNLFPYNGEVQNLYAGRNNKHTYKVKTYK